MGWIASRPCPMTFAISVGVTHPHVVGIVVSESQSPDEVIVVDA